MGLNLELYMQRGQMDVGWRYSESLRLIMCPKRVAEPQ